MTHRASRERRTRWVQRGRYAVEVVIEVFYPSDDPSEPCFDAETARFVDEVVQRAQAGDVVDLNKVGRVFESVEAA